MVEDIKYAFENGAELDDSLYIKYKDGRTYSFNKFEETGKFRKTNFDVVIFSNDCISVAYGKVVLRNIDDYDEIYSPEKDSEEKIWFFDEKEPETTEAETATETEPETATDPETAETEPTTEKGNFVYDVDIHTATGWDTYTVSADGLQNARYKAVKRVELETGVENCQSIDVIRVYKGGTDKLLKEIIVEENKEREESETAEPTAEKQATAEETADKGETTENGFNYKREIVLSGNSQILKNWTELTGISADEFLEALEWVCNDPLTEWGRITRKIGLTENGIVKLDVVRTKAYTALYHNGRLWRGGFFNVPCPKEYKDFSKDGKTIRVNQKITLSCKDRV